MEKNKNYKFGCFLKKYINFAIIITLFHSLLVLSKNPKIILTIDSKENNVRIFDNAFKSFPLEVYLDDKKLCYNNNICFYDGQIHNFPIGVHKVTLIWERSLNNCCFMFCNAKDIISVNLSDFDTSTVTNMTHMFFNCNKLTSIDVSTFNTQLVTDMKNMFEQCSSLESLDLRNLIHLK